MALRSRLKSFTRAGLFRAGLDVARFPRADTLPGLLHGILRDLRIDTVVDVGANTGQFGRLIRGIGHRGPIVSFEPVEEPYRVLAAEASTSPPWSVHLLALGEAQEERVMNVASESMLSSLLPASDAYDDLRLAGASVSGRTVQVDTLDAVATRDPLLLGADRILLKSDTQGYDANVLRGAAATMARVHALQVELAVRPIYEGVPDWLDVIGDLASAGFTLAGLYTANTDRHQRLVDVDGVFVRDVPERRP